jgi:MFS family permease
VAADPVFKAQITGRIVFDGEEVSEMDVDTDRPLQPRRALALAGTFGALRHRNFRLFWSGQLISLIGTWMQTVAIGWLVLNLTNSAFLLGVVTAIGSLPYLLLSLFAGVIADRVNKRSFLVMTQTALMLLAFLIAFLSSTGWIVFWEVVVISGLSGVANAFDAPARQSFVVEMVGKEDLIDAIGLNSTIFNAARIVGPAIAGGLLALVGVAGCFYVNGASFLAVIAALLMMTTVSPIHSGQTESVWHNLAEGMAYVRQDAMITAVIGMVVVPSVFGFSYTTLMPVFARDILVVGSSGLGFLTAATGIGALAAALSLTTLGRLLGKGRLMLISAVVFAVMVMGFGLSKSYPLSLVLLVGVGWATVSHLATTNTLLQILAPDALRGRVMGLYLLVLLGLGPFGSFGAGALAAAFGAPLAVAMGAAACCASALLILWRIPRLRELS